MVNDVKLQARIDKKSYDQMMSLLDEGETVSDYIRKSVKLQSTLRLLAKND